MHIRQSTEQTTKELEDTAEGKETKDMTKAAVIKATFRVLTLRLARAKVPLIVTNHLTLR